MPEERTADFHNKQIAMAWRQLKWIRSKQHTNRGIEGKLCVCYSAGQARRARTIYEGGRGAAAVTTIRWYAAVYLHLA